MKKKVKNIIFDLGDVIINIDVPRAAQSFATLSGRELKEVLEMFQENELFRQFETGRLDAAAFRGYVRQILQNEGWSDGDLDKAWNSLLLDIPPERIAMLQKLATRYRLFLLSNTSSIHIAKVNEILYETSGVKRLDDLFEKVYLSYEMGIMKPDAQIYERVLEDAGLVAKETLFLDDNADNIAAARTLGIKTIHVQKPLTMLDYLPDYVA